MAPQSSSDEEKVDFGLSSVSSFDYLQNPSSTSSSSSSFLLPDEDALRQFSRLKKSMTAIGLSNEVQNRSRFPKHLSVTCTRPYKSLFQSAHPLVRWSITLLFFYYFYCFENLNDIYDVFSDFFLHFCFFYIFISNLTRINDLKNFLTVYLPFFYEIKFWTTFP